MKEDRNDIVKELITKYLTGETSAEEERELFGWIGRSPENEAQYLDYKKVFELTRYHDASSADIDINIDQEWDHFTKTLDRKQRKTIQFKERQSTNAWLKMAAAILLLVVSGGIVYYYTNKGEVIHYQTADQTLPVTLPDGSQVTLNRNSKLSYSPAFNKDSRTITLKGEAFFEVAHDASKPFVIETNDARVEVLGTSFNVLAYDSLEAIEVVVQTGSVRFFVPGIKNEVKLNPGEKGVYIRESKQISSRANEDVNFQAWSTRKIIFAGDDLRTVIETLNKIYHSNIVITGDIPATCAVTVTFDNQSLESVLHVLESTLNLTYTVNGNQIEITDAGC